MSAEKEGKEESKGAPLELVQEMLDAATERDREKTLKLAKKVLELEPHNPIAIEYVKFLENLDSKDWEDEEVSSDDETSSSDDKEDDEEEDKDDKGAAAGGGRR